ncbi:recombination regulator RecX [Acidobacteria bacterium AH-259-D05]|nr:recombination regulator RecX [Acidobacteria bacterium AH-259-D05]
MKRLAETDLYKHALRLLGRRDHSRLELRRKLVRSPSSQDVDEVLDGLQEKGFLNDEAFALERAWLGRRHRRWGDVRLSEDLKRLGIDARMIQRVLERVNQEKGEAQTLQEVIGLWVNKSGRPETLSPLKKLYEHCIRLGYPPYIVRQQLEPYFEQVDWSGDHSERSR